MSQEKPDYRRFALMHAVIVGLATFTLLGVIPIIPTTVTTSYTDTTTGKNTSQSHHEYHSVYEMVMTSLQVTYDVNFAYDRGPWLAPVLLVLAASVATAVYASYRVVLFLLNRERK